MSNKYEKPYVLRAAEFIYSNIDGLNHKEILDGPLKGLEMHSWAETKGSAGAINVSSWIIPGGEGNEEARELIRNWAQKLPRCPWKWTFGERSRIGYLLPVFRRSRKAFARLGLSSWEGQ